VLKRIRSGIRKRYRSMHTVREIAKIYKVALGTVHRWKLNGMPYERREGVTLMDPRKVQKFLLFSRRS
jgi:transposase